MKARKFLHSHSCVGLIFWVGTDFWWKTHSWQLKSFFFLRCFTPTCSMACWYIWTTVSPISCKNDVSSHGTPPTNPWRRKDDGLPAPLEHFPSPHRTLEHKSLCSGGCTARFWRFSCPWIGCFCAHSLHATGGKPVLLSVGSPSKQQWGCIPLRGGALSCWSSLMRCNIDWIDVIGSRDMIFCFPDWILANPLLHFDSGSSPQPFRASLQSPFFNPSEFLIMFNCLIDERTMTSMFLRVWKFEDRVFHSCEEQLQKHGFPGHHSILTLWQTQANCLGTSTWSHRSQKTANLTNLSPNCLQLRKTYGRTM